MVVQEAPRLSFDSRVRTRIANLLGRPWIGSSKRRFLRGNAFVFVLSRNPPWRGSGIPFPVADGHPAGSRRQVVDDPRPGYFLEAQVERPFNVRAWHTTDAGEYGDHVKDDVAIHLLERERHAAARAGRPGRGSDFGLWLRKLRRITAT